MFANSMAEWLELNSFGIIDETIFINNLPERVGLDNIISLSDLQPLSIKGRARNSVNFKCQVYIRDTINKKALDKALDIYNKLEKDKVAFDKQGKRFTIRPLNPPTFLMYDEAGRTCWILDIESYAYNY